MVDTYVSIATGYKPLDDAYRNALLLVHRSVRQILNHFRSVQLSSVTSLCNRLN